MEPDKLNLINSVPSTPVPPTQPVQPVNPGFIPPASTMPKVPTTPVQPMPSVSTMPPVLPSSEHASSHALGWSLGLILVAVVFGGSGYYLGSSTQTSYTPPAVAELQPIIENNEGIPIGVDASSTATTTQAGTSTSTAPSTATTTLQ